MPANSIVDFFFGDQVRKLVIVTTAFVVAQSVAIVVVGRAALATYLMVSCVLFAVLIFLGVACYDRAISTFSRLKSRPRSQIRRSGESLDVLGTHFSWKMHEADVNSYLRHKRLAITGATSDVLPHILDDLLRHEPAAVYLLDDDREALRRYFKYVRRRNPKLHTEFVVCRLADFSQLERELEQRAPEVLLDATAYRFIKGRSVDSARDDADAQRLATAAYERAEIVSNLAGIWTKSKSIQSVLLPLPRSTNENVAKNWSALYQELIRDTVTEVGAHSADRKAVLSFWQPVRVATPSA